MNIRTVISIVRETDQFFFDDALRGDVTQKGASDYVTRADLAISDFLHRRLQETYPDIAFLSEEENACIVPGQAYWILDPIDGTTNYMHGLGGMSAVSLGYCDGDEITAGIIYIPYAKELYYAEKGKGAYLNDTPISVSKNASLPDCLAFLEFNGYYKQDHAAALDHAKKLFLSCQDLRTLGCAAATLAYIASGRADVFLGRYLKPWDYAAGLILVKEAGGCVSEPDGSLHITELNRHIIATNAAAYESFRALINE